MTPPTSLRRQLSLLDCFGIGINGIVGSGIFFLPAVVFRLGGGRAPLAWLLVGALCSLVALCFAEAASRTDRSGGPYRYACDAFGSRTGFAIGWITLISSLLGYTAVARGFGQTAAVVLGAPGRTALELSVSAVIVLSLGAINILGVRLGARTSAAVSLVKLLGLLTFIAVGLRFVNWSHFSLAPSPLPGERVGLFGAAFAGLFATTGFEYVPVPAGEAIDPRRTVPLAMVVSVLGATLLYVLVQIVADGTTPHLGSSSAALVDAASGFGGPRGKLLMGLAGLLSSFGFCVGSALVGPRYLEAFAHDRFLPQILTYRHPRRGTPVMAIVALSGMVVLLLLSRLPFESLANVSNVAVVMQYMATCSAVLVLRRRDARRRADGDPTQDPRRFVVPGGPLVPVLALSGSCLFLLYVGMRELYLAGGLIALGLICGALFHRAR